MIPWVALAQATKGIGDSIKGDELNAKKNYWGNLANTDNVSKIKEAFAEGNTWEKLDTIFTGGLLGTQGRRQAREAQQRKLEEEQRLQIQSVNEGNMRLQNYDSFGSNENNIYAAFGGAMPINQHMTSGGSINKISKDNYQVSGNSHERGGVKLLGQGIELEGKETINNTGEPFVFSEELGFARKHKPIARAIAKVEKKPYNAIAANTLKLLKQKEEQLKIDQEQLKNSLGIGTPISQYI